MFRRVALSQHIHRKLVYIHRSMLFFIFWTLSFHTAFDEVPLGRPWGPLAGVGVSKVSNVPGYIQI